MKKRVSCLPNILTALRFILTIQFICALLGRFNHVSTAIPAGPYILFALICLTDLLDGAAARGLHAQTAFGAALDVAADLLFMISSFVLFNISGVLPVWFTVFVAADFLVFLSTSRVLTHTKGNDSRKALVFDADGRAAAILFYLIPAAACWAYDNPGFLSAFALNALLYTSVILAGVAVFKRCILCLRTKGV
jgi:phosphatidylglycerophosphate synthase